MDAAILFESDGYRLDGAKLMGRQAAGNGFLRAAVAAQAGQVMWGFSPFGDAFGPFTQTVRELDPEARTAWIRRDDLKAMAERQVLFRPDGELADLASLRLRAGPAAFSICGVTHTLSGPPMARFSRLPAEALAPWDALICTSRAARSVIEGALEAGEDFLAWRLGTNVAPPRIQLPVIPLGIHAEDFAFSGEDRIQARAELGLADDEVAALCPGRLVFHAKAHPFQMFQALEATAQTTGQKLVLMLAGQAPNAGMAKAYVEGAARYCPSVRTLFIDGKDFARYRAGWAAADLFISLSDNIQETFGITPLEAMAAGLPVVVSDWDGYRDTVRDGEDGFRIRTWQPALGHAEGIARAFEAGTLNYDYLLFRTCMAVPMDAQALVERLTALVTDPDLRRRMGEAGRRRAREDYDWGRIYARYRQLWDELVAIRAREYAADRDYWDRAPRAAPGHRDPFEAFAGFATATLGPDSRLIANPAASLDAYLALQADPLFSHWKVTPEIIGRMLARLQAGPAAIADLQAAAGLGAGPAVELAARLVKMNLVRPI